MLGRWTTFTPLTLVLVVSAIAAAGCASDEPELPDTTAASVLAYLEEVDYQNNEDWKLWPGLGEKYQGQEPHGMLLTTYLNPLAYDALTGKKGSMPNDAIIVKENYTPEGEFAANTVMYKKSGYNPRAQRLVLAEGPGGWDGGQGGHGSRVPGLPRPAGPQGQRLHHHRAAEIEGYPARISTIY